VIDSGRRMGKDEPRGSNKTADSMGRHDAMTCPQCSKRIPANSLWTPAGLSGIECPHCHVHLCPTPFCAIVLFLASFAFGDIALLVLHRMGDPMWVGLTAFFAVFAAAFFLLAPLVLRLRMKERRAHPRLTDRKA
jgi:hypothetical protein